MTETKGWRIRVALALVTCLPLLLAGPGYSTHLDPGKNDGCPHSFWKNNLDAWEPTGYSSGQTLSEVGFVFPAAFASLANATLLEALGFSGGRGLLAAAQGLMREAAAAILNAAHPTVVYPVEDTQQLIARVNLALSTEVQRNLLSQTVILEGWNRLGCPLR